MEPWVITTVYPDGRTEERLSTPEEIAQREADIAAYEARLAEEEALRLENEALRQSAISKLTSLGLTEQEALAIIGS